MSEYNFNCHCIVDTNEASFSAFWEMLETSFPKHECRLLENWVGAVRDQRSQVRLYTDRDGEPCAILCAWNLDSGRYVEYFAVCPKLRGKGIGKEIFRSFITENTKKVILEIEPLSSRKNILRWKFYQSLGFSKNPGMHEHPPYRMEDEPEQLIILNLGNTPLCQETRENFLRELDRRVMCYSCRNG